MTALLTEIGADLCEGNYWCAVGIAPDGRIVTFDGCEDPQIATAPEVNIFSRVDGCVRIRNVPSEQIEQVLRDEWDVDLTGVHWILK